jgi:hypothetical protein
MADTCEHDNETSGPIKDEEFTDKLWNYQSFKYDSAPWLSLFN